MLGVHRDRNAGEVLYVWHPSSGDKVPLRSTEYASLTPTLETVSICIATIRITALVRGSQALPVALPDGLNERSVKYDYLPENFDDVQYCTVL